MVNPIKDVDSYSLISASPIEEVQEETQSLLTKVTFDRNSPFFNPDVLNLSEAALGLEINRLDILCKALEIEELDQVIQSVVNLNAPAAMKARILLPQIIAQGPTIWKRLIPILKGNPEEHKELFFWLIRGEASSTINAADLIEIEGQIGDLANKHVKDLIPKHLNFGNFVNISRQIMMWGRFFTPATVTLMLKNIDVLDDNNDKATILVFILLFCFPCPVEIPNYAWITEGNFEMFKPVLQEFQKYYTIGEKINKHKLLSVLNLKVPPLMVEIYVKSKLSSLAPEDLPAVADLYNYPMIWYVITIFLNHIAESLPLNAIPALTYNTTSFQYLSDRYLKQIFLNDDFLKGFRENDIELIQTNVLFVLADTGMETIKIYPVKFARSKIIFLCFLERWSLVYPELKPSLEKFFDADSLFITQFNLRYLDTSNREGQFLNLMWIDFMTRHLSAAELDEFNNNCYSLKNNPGRFTYKTHPESFRRLILNSAEDRQALGQLNWDELITIIRSANFTNLIIRENRSRQAFKLFLTLDTPDMMLNWVISFLTTWIAHTPTTTESLRTLDVVKEVLPHIPIIKDDTELLMMTRPGALLLEVMRYILERKVFSNEQLTFWIDNLLHADNIGGDKSFWTQAYALMKKHVSGPRNQYVPRWKQFEERIKSAKESPDETTLIVQQNQHQSSTVPLSVAIQPQKVVKPAAPAPVGDPDKTPIERLNEQVVPLLTNPLAITDLLGIILAGGSGLWSFIVAKMTEMSEEDLIQALKTVTLIRNIPHMIQPRGKDREWLDQQQQKVGNVSDVLQVITAEIQGEKNPLEAKIELLSRFGKVQSDQVVKLIGEAKNCDNFTQEDADLFFARLLATDCDERMLADLAEWELFLNKTPLPFEHECFGLLKDIIAFRKRALIGTGIAFMDDLTKQPNAIFKPVLNLISAQLTVEDLVFILDANIDDVLVIGIVAQAMRRIYNAGEKATLGMQQLVAKATLIDGLLFQIDSRIMIDCFGKDHRVLDEENPLKEISTHSAYLLNELKNPNCELTVTNLALLSILMRVIWVESLTNPAFKEFYNNIMETEIVITVGLSLSTLSIDNLLHNAIINTWFRQFTLVPKPVNLKFKINTLSISCLHIKKENLESFWGTIAILKDIGISPDWYATHREQVIRIFTSEYFFEAITKTAFVFPDSFAKIVGRTTLFDAAVEIYLMHFKGEKKLEVWLSQFVILCLMAPTKISQPDRFNELLEVLNPSDALLDKLLSIGVPSPLTNILLTKAYSRRFVPVKGAKPQLLDWMDKFLDHAEGTLDDWTKALDLFKTLKPQLKKVTGQSSKAKITRYNKEFDQKVILFNQKIKQLAGSDTEKERQIAIKIKNIGLSINEENRRLREHVEKVIGMYENQQSTCSTETLEEEKAKSISKVLVELKKELITIHQRFDALLIDTKTKIEMGLKFKTTSEKLKHFDNLEIQTREVLKLLSDAQTVSINKIKSDMEIEQNIHEQLQLTILSICGEKEIQKNRINQLIFTYQKQIDDNDHKILGEEGLASFQNLIGELNTKLTNLEDLFSRQVVEAMDLFTKATSAELYPEKIENVNAWIKQVTDKLESLVETEILSLKKLETEHLDNLKELHRLAALRIRQLELDAQILFPKAVDSYEQAIADYKNSLLELKNRFSTDIEDSQIAEITTLFHKKMTQIAESAVPKAPTTSPSPDSRLKTKIAKLKQREAAFQKEILSLQERIEQQNEEIGELKYRQYTPEQLVEKQLSARAALVVNLERLIEANQHVVAAAAINKIIQCEGKILTTLPELFKVLKLAGFKKVNVVGNHRKFVGEFTKVTIFNHTNQSYDIEILKVLERLLETSEHWLKDAL